MWFDKEPRPFDYPVEDECLYGTKDERYQNKWTAKPCVPPSKVSYVVEEGEKCYWVVPGRPIFQIECAGEVMRSKRIVQCFDESHCPVGNTCDKYGRCLPVRE